MKTNSTVYLSIYLPIKSPKFLTLALVISSENRLSAMNIQSSSNHQSS